MSKLFFTRGRDSLGRQSAFLGEAVIGHTGRLRHVRERAVAVVAEQKARRLDARTMLVPDVEVE